MNGYVEIGQCSGCAQPAKRDAGGAWWHIGQSCWQPHVHDPEVAFVPADQTSKQEDNPRSAPQSEQAEREQPSAPRDRQIRSPRSNR